jgi:type II secretory pathway pseudopilin PulG
MKLQKGISLIALIITIIVIIILAAIVIGVAINTPENANRAKFASDISEVQHAVSTKLAENYNQFITNPETIDLNSGFTRMSVIGAPESFNGFAPENGETGTIGYLVNMDTIKLERLSIGQGYNAILQVTFGETDAFVYDDEGEVFYAKGHKYKENIYYTVNDLENDQGENGGEPSEEPDGGSGSKPNTSPDDPVFICGANTPNVYSGMKKVRWDASRTLIDENNATFEDDVWYDYIAQTKDTANGAGRSWN